MKLKWFPWNGSKRSLLPYLQQAFAAYPQTGRYFEPFVGGGSVSFLFRSLYPDTPQHLSDLNPWLCAAYKMQKEDVAPLLSNALDYNYWRNIRDQDLSGMTLQEQATRFASCLFTAWGNRWKTEADGHFTPSSTPVNPKFCDPVKLRQQLEGFSKVRWLTPVDSIQTSNWAQALEAVAPGDLVYLDPPYPEHLGYGTQIWTLSDMLDTIDWIAEANRKGVFILASNVADLERLYQRAGLRTRIITLSEASLTRKARREVLATNLPGTESLLDRMLALAE